ncbi:uncharacterized protein PRCAT00003985001 [Priceomyces carsonii]|uniref:uncharacterized protein n=1 Tax=Priceomyces carsonii TaxID=28549 RepID=UPI002ED8FEBE|nr:unnamed protein product [Priceomyces carsonii]
MGCNIGATSFLKAQLGDSPRKLLLMLKKYMKFIGPGLMVSVAYMDPGNYSTAVAAGSAYKYNLLFLILLSNCLAIFLQVLSAKLGAVTGLDLASNCKNNFSFRTNICIYILAEIAIIATDLAEVVGTAISLNILFHIPLFLGVLITVIDVLIVLLVYRPNGPLFFIRIFELFVSALVGATLVCFAIELYQVSHDSGIKFSISDVLKGFLPNQDVINMEDREGGNGLFLSLAILGATVMPHSLYLGSGLVQPRLKDYDIKHGFYFPDKDLPIESSEAHDVDEVVVQAPSLSAQNEEFEKNVDSEEYYRPSIHAINETMTYTIIELVISLLTVALFVNSAILIVAGATLNNDELQKYPRDDQHEDDSDSDGENNYTNADLFTIYNLLSNHLSPTAGFVFALALLCSGQSAGVVCTLAGQMVSEGFLLWSLPPVTRRLITRGLAIIPCLLVVSFTGREGLGRILNSSQVVLSILLPVVSAPLIMFTCSKKIMRVPIFERDGDETVDIIVDAEETYYRDNSIPGKSYKNDRKFQSTDAAIMLQDLRKSHPCAGWEGDDIEGEHQGLMDPVTISLSTSLQKYSPYDRHNLVQESSTDSANIGNDIGQRIKGFKDMSNSRFTAFVAILVWGFITCLNLYLIGSFILGFDVPL